MNNNFMINTNFQTEQFNNSIGNFNKEFNKNFKNSIAKTNEISEFDKVFNSIRQKPLSAGVSIDENKGKHLSPAEKTANDIGTSIVNGLNDLNNIQRKAETDFETFASGGDISVHDVMISAQKSNLSMQMAVQLRNKFLNAYNELKSMSV